MGREGKRREEGRERKGRDEGGKGKVTEGMGGTVQDMGWEGGKERERTNGREREERGYSPTNFNSWRRHCHSRLQAGYFLRPRWNTVKNSIIYLLSSAAEKKLGKM